MTLFEQTKTIPVLEAKKVLEVKNYSFPFQFVVPDDLPSAMDVQCFYTYFSYYMTVYLTHQNTILVWKEQDGQDQLQIDRDFG